MRRRSHRTGPDQPLLPDVIDAVDLPVLAAGGYRCGRGLVAALSFGAAGRHGDALAEPREPGPAAGQGALLQAQVTDTTVSTRSTGTSTVITTPSCIGSRGVTATLSALRSGFAFRRVNRWVVGLYPPG